MKYFKTQDLWKASNVQFRTNPIIATSYNWWTFVARINGLVVFNKFRYSTTTGAHQRKVRSLMRDLGIKIDLEVETCKSLGNSDWLNDAVELQQLQIDDLWAQNMKRGSKRAKNEERLDQIVECKAQIERLKSLMTVKDNVIQLRKV